MGRQAPTCRPGRTARFISRLGSPPAGDVRFYAVGYPTDADHARRGAALGSFFAGHLALRAGVSSDQARFNLQPSAHRVAVGRRAGKHSSTYSTTLRVRCMDGSASRVWTSSYPVICLTPRTIVSNTVSTRRFFGASSPPAPTTSLYTFTEQHLGALTRQPVSGLEVPRWSVAVTSDRTAPSQIATGATAQMRDYLTREVWSAFSGVSASTKLAEPGAEHLDVEFAGRHFVNTFSSRLWLLSASSCSSAAGIGSTRSRCRCRRNSSLSSCTMLSPAMPLLRLSGGRKHRIVGMLLDCNARCR